MAAMMELNDIQIADPPSDLKNTQEKDGEDSDIEDGNEDKDAVGDDTLKTRNRSDKEKKLGHRRVGVGGEITYKKIQSRQIMGSIQLGIEHAVGGLASKPERDLLMQDFMTVETTLFTREGSNHTPAHYYSDFTFKTYAPIAFRYFRDLFGIQPDDFLISFCSADLRELSNPGASGSIFYLTQDDEFIIKTVQHKEGEFLQKLLPGYYMCNSKNIRLVAMNNLLPSNIKIHLKYDLKGSTYKRKASKAECQKNSPTYKDLDFMEHHAEGIFLEAETYSALVRTIQRDCRVLESFKIMDYSLLVGIHNLDLANKEKLDSESASVAGTNARPSVSSETNIVFHTDAEEKANGGECCSSTVESTPSSRLPRTTSMRQKLVAHSTAMESIAAESDPIDEVGDLPPGGIPARNAKGERLLLFIGIIDILQSYRLKKKMEHTLKALFLDGDTVSVHRPAFYAGRFQDFMTKHVFKKIPSPLKHSPSKRKSFSSKPFVKAYDIMEPNERSITPPAISVSPPVTLPSSPPCLSPTYPSVLKDRILPVNSAIAATSHPPPPVPPRGVRTKGKRYYGFAGYGVPNNLPSASTPPPGFYESRNDQIVERHGVESSSSTPIRKHGTAAYVSISKQLQSINISDVKLEMGNEQRSNSSMASSSSASGICALYPTSAVYRHVTWTAPASVDGSMRTWTEGTPSFTESSSSGDVGCPTTPVKGGRQRKLHIVQCANTEKVVKNHIEKDEVEGNEVIEITRL